MSYATLDLYGEDWLGEQILAEKHLTTIAADAGVAVSTLVKWIDRDPGRRGRIDDVRRQCAQMWEERAERVITEATTSFELTKARDLAHHYRWRAAKIAPKKYGDKVVQELTGPGGAPLASSNIDLTNLPDDVIKALMDARAKD
jgi:hypothetical protein